MFLFVCIFSPNLCFSNYILIYFFLWSLGYDYSSSQSKLLLLVFSVWLFWWAWILLPYLYYGKFVFLLQLQQIFLWGGVVWVGICSVLDVVQMVFPVYVTCGFSLATFKTLPLFCISSVLTIIWSVKCLFLALSVYLVFWVPLVCLTSSSFLSLEKIPSMILLKILSMPLILLLCLWSKDLVFLCCIKACVYSFDVFS